MVTQGVEREIEAQEALAQISGSEVETVSSRWQAAAKKARGLSRGHSLASLVTKSMKQKAASPGRWAVRRSSVATAESPTGARTPATTPALSTVSVGAQGATAVPGELLDQLNRMEVR